MCSSSCILMSYTDMSIIILFENKLLLVYNATDYSVDYSFDVLLTFNKNIIVIKYYY